MMDDSPQVHGSQEHWFSWRHSDLTPSTMVRCGHYDLVTKVLTFASTRSKRWDCPRAVPVRRIMGAEAIALVILKWTGSPTRDKNKVSPFQNGV
jgi:hypothetical protein